MNERVPLVVSRWNRATVHVFADPDARSRAIESVDGAFDATVSTAQVQPDMAA